MATNKIKLLGAWASPYTNRVRIAFNLKSIKYEYIEEDLAQKSDFLIKSNPVHKKVPVLFHGNKPPINESLVIVQYIDELWTNGPSILPSDPYDRATARFWASYIDDQWYPCLRELTITAEREEEKARLKARLDEGLALLEEVYVKCSNNGKKAAAYFGGDRIGYLDIALGCSLAWLRAGEKVANLTLLDVTKTPGLVGWAHNFCLDDAVKDVMQDPQKLVELAKMIKGLIKEVPSN